jgi:EF-hand domain pair
MMTRKTLMAGAAICGLVFATAVWAAQDKDAGKEGHGWGHGRWAESRGGPDGMADHLMQKFDLNKDGKITKDEIERAMKQEMDAHFASLDANHDGTVSADEFYQAHAARMREHTDEMFKRLDKNGDGKLTPDEFAAAGPMMMHHHEGMHGHHGGMDDDDDMPPMPGHGGMQP